MCLSTVYNHEKNDDNILCRYVASIEVDGDRLTFTDVMGMVTQVTRPSGQRRPHQRHRGGVRGVRSGP